MNRPLALAAALWALAGSAPAADAPPLRVWVSTSWAPPFLLPEVDGVRRGLIPDWYAALGQALGRRLEISYVPPRRITRDATHQELDLRCFGSRTWQALGETKGYQDAARPLVAVDEVVVGPTTGPVADRWDALQGRRIGTVTSYAYPTLEARFASGAMQREDAPEELSMLRKQLQGRTDFVILRRWTLEHLQRQDPQWLALRVSRDELFCGVRPGGRLSLPALEAAQQKLLRDGSLDRLLARYGLSR